MKIIHCADLHLDSGLQTHLSREKAGMRRNELLSNFGRLADYASQNGVEIILIAGDLFDRDKVSALTGNMVLSVIAAHPEIRFYYLRGNHDTGDCLRRQTGGQSFDKKAVIPENLFLFGSRWKTYAEGEDGRIAIAGIELTGENSAAAHASLRLDPDCFNIVMLHGQIYSGEIYSGGVSGSGEPAVPGCGLLKKGGSGGKPAGAGNAGTISLRALRGKEIDYLALGHIHSWKKDKLDGRGIYCYPGCLEGRGFDESGEHGFALLEIDEWNRLRSHRFIPFARRILYNLEVDVSGCSTTARMTEKITDRIRGEGCSPKDMADITLTGELDVECEKDTDYIASALSGMFFFARLRDRTRLRIDIKAYLHDESLRGEFVRKVLGDASVPEKEKTEVIRLGFMAMDGEELP